MPYTGCTAAAAVHKPAPATTLQAAEGAAGGIARGGLARGRCIGPALLRMRGGSSFARSTTNPSSSDANVLENAAMLTPQPLFLCSRALTRAEGLRLRGVALIQFFVSRIRIPQDQQPKPSTKNHQSLHYSTPRSPGHEPATKHNGWMGHPRRPCAMGAVVCAHRSRASRWPSLLASRLSAL